MTKLQRILLATDFSEYSQEARDFACTLADRFDVELHVLYVFEEPIPTQPVPGMAFPPADSYLEELKNLRAKQLKEVIDAAWERSHRVVRATAQGVPFVEIIRYAREHEIDLIVLGTHGRTGLAHALLGSVAEKVVRKASCAVLTVRPSEFHFVRP
jgi:nucleotide-binding universal stress UspA family protein